MKHMIICIGNRQGGDDAIGPYIADQMNKQTNDFLTIDCGIIPENYTSLVKQHKPEMLLIIDAVDMGLSPGDIRIIPKEKIGTMHISTHGISLSLLVTYLEHYVKNIIIIGIEPKVLSGTLSTEVQKSADRLITLLKTHTFHKIPIL